ncbi:MAG: ATP-dependent DNA helicase RecG [Parcubacteria group bacterium GW2011_GWA2_47_12]|nr:MAG: ATP-dependent DNA helicase RecG [Parcubacteria group bacterium GW2011_GWA2_47_12]
MNLQSLIADHFRLTEAERKGLKKLGIETVEDMLNYFPSRYGSVSEMCMIANLVKGESATVFGRVGKLEARKAFRSKMALGTAELADDTGKIKLIWFNQPYLAKMIPEGALVRVEGKVSQKRNAKEFYFSNPKIERVEKIPLSAETSLFGTENDAHHLHPIYPETRGVSSNWLFHVIQKIMRSGALDFVQDQIPADILKKYSLPSRKTALIWIHAPKKEGDARAARKRFAFEEVFLIQLQKQKEKKLWKSERAFAIEKTDAQIAKFTERFPFSLTSAQCRAIEAISADFQKGTPMARLLEGDVGSGKTAVAAATAYAVVSSRPEGQSFGNLQVAYLCPTEILAKQQFENFISFFSHLPINIGLITSSGCRKFPSKVNPHGATDISRAQLLKWVGNGEIPVLVGTHSLIQKSVQFKHLAYAIIDEQHRFGVKQRKALVHKDKIVPHLLSMTATPIPRTLALTIFGDLDLTLLDEMPPGRKPVHTEIVLPNERDATYEKIRSELKNGRQCYIITPRIDEPDPAKEFAVQAKSAKAEAKRLKEKVFPEYEIAVMHSKLKDSEKESVMEDFKDGKTHILVSTSVVEVGVNVPNATLIIIEGAERFGLAQLHQLRGRVLRSAHQAHCFVFTESKGKAVAERLAALGKAKNGFELAEYDLEQRGAGELSGREQWGVSDIAMEALQNLKMVEAARAEAARLIAEDDALSKYPLLARHLAARAEEKIHFE